MVYTKQVVSSFIALSVAMMPIAPAVAMAKEGPERPDTVGVSLDNVGPARMEDAEDGEVRVTAVRAEVGDGEREQEREQRRYGQDDDSDIEQNDDEEREVRFSRETVDALIVQMGSTTRVAVPEEVKNYGDLRSFVAHTLKSDERVRNANVSSTTVSADYAVPAKFLGIFPAPLLAHVEVSSEGEVKTEYPWYAFFYGGTRGQEVRNVVSDAVHAIQASSTEATSTEQGIGEQVRLTARAQSEFFKSIVSSLSALFGGSNQ